MKNKEKDIPGMSDVKEVFKVIEDREKEERRRLWLKEHRLSDKNHKGGEENGKSKTD